MLKGLPATTNDAYPLNMIPMFRRAARFFPDQPIVHRTADGKWARTDYATEWRRLARIAHALTGLGVGPGDAVGVMDWNSLRHFELYFAVPGLAATMVQLNLRLSPEDLGYVIAHSGCRWICVDESLLPLAEKHKDAPGIGWIVMSDRPGAEISTSLPDPVFLEDLVAEAEEDYPWEEVEETTAAYAGYTTGTTGRPKGIFYSHRAMYLHSTSLCSSLQIDDQDCVMPLTPMFHVMSWGFPQATVAAAARLVLPGRYQASDLAPLTRAIIDEDVTVTNGAPSVFGPMLEQLRAMDTPPDLGRVRLISGSIEPPLALMRGFKELTGADLVHAYGASETSPVATVNWKLKPGLGDLTEEQRWDLKRSQGLPVLGVDLRIEAPGGGEQPMDGTSAGEILMRGPWVTASYHDRPDSADSFEDGWWRSGDVGVLQPTGYLKLTDRLKDVIKSGGEWISSIDLENAILDNDRVLEAAVIGVPDPQWQERPVAYVVPREGAELTEEQVRDGLAGRFAGWQLPDRILLVEELPKTSVGKLNKKVLREQYRG